MSLDELWKVGRGEVDFREFRKQQRLDEPSSPVAVVEAPTAAPPSPPPPPKVKKEKQPPAAVRGEPPPSPPPAAAKDVELGTSRGLKDLDVRALIKPSEVPLLSEEKKTAKEKPMDYIVQNAAVDPNTKWRRLYNLGSHVELFVSVNQSEEQGPYTVSITTDAAFPFVLHWGVSKTGKGRDWNAPAAELLPPHLTEVTEDKRAAETIFGDCQEEECDVELIGSRVPLQRAKLIVPWDAGVSNVLFVLRSADRSMWYKDGHGNFVVPLPGHTFSLSRHIEIV